LASSRNLSNLLFPMILHRGDQGSDLSAWARLICQMCKRKWDIDNGTADDRCKGGDNETWEIRVVLQISDGIIGWRFNVKLSSERSSSGETLNFR
jgi:hypothetical protein